MSDTVEMLMQRALKGDGRAYQQVLQYSSRALRPFLLRRISSLAAAEDVLQEILISVHKSRHTYDGKRPYMPWLFAIARYRLADYLRSDYKDKLRHAADISDYEQMLPQDVTETGVASEYLEKAIKQLPEKQAKILTLMHQQGYTAKETAKQMNMTEVAVKVSAHRAYKLLKAKMGQYGGA